MSQGIPQLFLLAGANGVGKSTFHRLFLEPRGMALVNADRIALSLRPTDPQGISGEAAAEALLLADHLLEKGVSFCYETVFSHVSKIDLVARARALGYQVIIVFIHLTDIQLNLARIAQRVSTGGHPVPEDKVRARLPRVLGNMAKVLPLADEVIFCDNSSADEPFRLVGRMQDGKPLPAPADQPLWLDDILSRGEIY